MCPSRCSKHCPFSSNCPLHSEPMNLPPTFRRNVGSALHIPSSLYFHLPSFPLRFCRCLSLPRVSSPLQDDDPNALRPSSPQGPRVFHRHRDSRPSTARSMRTHALGHSNRVPFTGHARGHTGVLRSLISLEGVVLSHPLTRPSVVQSGFLFTTD